MRLHEISSSAPAVLRKPPPPDRNNPRDHFVCIMLAEYFNDTQYLSNPETADWIAGSGTGTHYMSINGLHSFKYMHNNPVRVFFNERGHVIEAFDLAGMEMDDEEDTGEYANVGLDGSGAMYYFEQLCSMYKEMRDRKLPPSVRRR
jgi:hypothetical protein